MGFNSAFKGLKFGMAIDVFGTNFVFLFPNIAFVFSPLIYFKFLFLSNSFSFFIMWLFILLFHIASPSS